MTALKIAYERGKLSDEDFVDQAMELCGFAGSRENFIRHWQDYDHREDDAARSCLKALGLRIAEA